MTANTVALPGLYIYKGKGGAAEGGEGAGAGCCARINEEDGEW